MTWTDFMQRLFQHRQPTAAEVRPAALVRLNAELSALRSTLDAGAIREAMGSYDGYVREAALIRCVELGEAGLLPAVVERLNDWVPQIRHVARSAMLEILPAAEADLAMSVLPDVQRLACATREDHSAWIARFELALLDKVGADTVLDAARTAGVKLARACFELLARHGAVDSRALTDMALASRRDVVLAMRALDAFAPRAGEASPEALGIYRRAMRSKFGTVRAQALRWLLTVAPEEVNERGVVDALLDSHSGARSAAAFYLRRAGFDLRSHYREAAAGALPARHRVTALQSLAHLRDSGDLAFVRGFTQSANASLRKAAWLGLLRIAPHEQDEVALGMLSDDERFIRAAALKLVKFHGAHIATDVACPILLARGDVDLLLVFIARSKWGWLEWLARLASDMPAAAPADAPVHGQLAASLAEWAKQERHFYDRPTEGQARYLATPACRSVLEQLADKAGSGLRQLTVELDRLASPAQPRSR